MTSLYASSRAEESDDSYFLGTGTLEPPTATEFPGDQPVAEPDPDHDLAIESPMPTIRAQRERKTHLAILIPLSALVVSCFIGVPLALFVHGFTHAPMIAGAIAAIALGAFFGGVVMGLRATTRTPGASTSEAIDLTAAAAGAAASAHQAIDVTVTAATALASTPMAVHLTAPVACTPATNSEAADPTAATAAVPAAPASTPEAIDLAAVAAGAPASTPEAIDPTAAAAAVPAEPASTPEPIELIASAGAPASAPQANDLTAAATEIAVPLQTRLAPPSSGIVGLLFSGPPTAAYRRIGPARRQRATTNADLLGEILGFRPEREREPEELEVVP